MDRKPNAPASPVLVSAPVDGLGVPLNLEARAAQLLDEGQAVVLLTVVEREGSAPRAAGTRGLLTAAGGPRRGGGQRLPEGRALRPCALRSYRPWPRQRHDLRRQHGSAL